VTFTLSRAGHGLLLRQRFIFLGRQQKEKRRVPPVCCHSPVDRVGGYVATKGGFMQVTKTFGDKWGGWAKAGAWVWRKDRGDGEEGI